MKAIFFSLFILASSLIYAQCESDWEQFLDDQMTELKTADYSPLSVMEKGKLKRLDYYDFDQDYCVKAYLIPTPDAEPFEMITSTDRRPMYVKYAVANFEIKGKPHSLSLYQSVEHMKMDEYKDDLFLPFGDQTNGDESYGGGRFISLKIPEVNEMGIQVLQIDFNSSYNPYCAYNHDRSCPAPPKENILEIPIEAGVKGLVFKK